MNLIAEQGNTSSKVVVHKNGYIEASFVYKQFGVSVVATLFGKYAFTQDVSSTMIDTDDELIVYLKNKLQRFVLLDEHVALPVKVEYGTPRALDKGRSAAVVGVNYLRPGENLLVVNVGAAITYGVIEAPGIFLRGNIPPGMITHFRASNHLTKKLPLVTEEDDIPLIGRSTETAIRTGVVNGTVYEMDRYTGELKTKYPDLLVFLTGGHLFYFKRWLENSVFIDISLVLTRLNKILEYNAED